MWWLLGQDWKNGSELLLRYGYHLRSPKLTMTDGESILNYKENTGSHATPAWEDKKVRLSAHAYCCNFGTRPGINVSIPFSNTMNDLAIKTICSEADIHHAVNVHIHDRLLLEGYYRSEYESFLSDGGEGAQSGYVHPDYLHFASLRKRINMR